MLGAENVNLSGGRLEQGTQQFLVRTVNQFQTVEEIGGVIIDQSNLRRPVYLRDVALVRMGYKEREAITRINGVEAVEVVPRLRRKKYRMMIARRPPIMPALTTSPTACVMNVAWL